MSRVEVVRRIFEARRQGDFRTGAELFDDTVTYVNRPEFPDPGVYVGPEQIAEYTRDLLASWSDFTFEAEELLDAGDTVFVQLRQRGVGRTSGAKVDLQWFQLITFRGDAIVRMENFRDRNAALAAAGIS